MQQQQGRAAGRTAWVPRISDDWIHGGLLALNTGAIGILITFADRFAATPGWLAVAAIPFALGMCVTLHSLDAAGVEELHLTRHRSRRYHAIAVALFVIGTVLALLPISV